MPPTTLRLRPRFAALGAVLTALVLVPPTAAQSNSPGDTFTETIPGTQITFRMTFVPGGSFSLGSPETEAGRDADEGPQRRVGVDAFWMGVHEVTYDAFSIFQHRNLDNGLGGSSELPFGVDMITRPSQAYEDPAHGMGATGHPMVGMTRVAAMEFARWLSEKTGRLYRLPTEAEWEHACRAGGDDVYTFGDNPGTLVEHAWYANNSGDTFHEVGLKEPNAWGIHDLHGNVAEWTMDRYAADFYAGIPDDEPTANPRAEQSTRGLGVVRGGAYNDDAAGLRCAERFAETTRWKRRDPQMPKSRWWNTDSPHLGFRLMSPAREYTQDEIRSYWDAILGER